MSVITSGKLVFSRNEAFEKLDKGMIAKLVLDLEADGAGR